jgi:hypothetical protein
MLKVAMGHDCARIADGFQVSRAAVRRIVVGQTGSATPAFLDRTCQLWTAWRERFQLNAPAAQRGAAAAQRQAERRNWRAAFEEDLLNGPGHPGAGTGQPPAPITPPNRSHG